jgi:polysaccharide deacetylase 2 family uncharacterized protein YibQ
MLYGGIVFLLLFGWMALRSGDTAQRLQDIIPVKTAPIEVAEVKTEDPHAPQEGLQDKKNINALPPAPIEGLSENLDGKFLPKSRIEDDLSPFNAYKKPFALVAGKTQISVVIVDFGLSSTLAQSILDNMPPEISLVLTPYAAEPSKWASAARAYGHEFWLQLPMQTAAFGKNDTGPSTILSTASVEENRKRLFDVLGVAVGYAGLVSEKNHILTQGSMDTKQITDQIFGRGLAFAESTPDIPAFGLSTAMEFGYPYVQNNFWLDEDLRPESIDAALQRLEIQASRKGRAIAFLHPYPVAVNKVQEWIKHADQKNIQIVPLSALVQ